MNTYLVELLVNYKNGAKEQRAQWVVNANNKIEAQAQALYKENHTYTLSEVDKICLDNEYTELKEGSFHYKIDKVIELQEAQIVGLGELKTVLVPKDKSLIDTLDDIAPISGSYIISHVVVDWLVDGKHKEIKVLAGGNNQWVSIANALYRICGSMKDDEVDAVIHKRAIFDTGDKGSFMLKSSSESCLHHVSIDGKDDYLVRISSDDERAGAVPLAVWNAGL